MNNSLLISDVNVSHIPGVARCLEIIPRAVCIGLQSQCSLEFQNVMDIIIKSLINWSTDDRILMGPCMAGDVTAWVQAAEEQGRGTLHAHWQLFTTQLSNEARANLFHRNTNIRNNARKELIDYIDNMICASYRSDIELIHTCEENIQPHKSRNEILNNRAKTTAPKDARFIQRHAQIFRNARHKVSCNRAEGNLIMCNKCDADSSNQMTLLITSFVKNQQRKE